MLEGLTPHEDEQEDLQQEFFISEARGEYLMDKFIKRLFREHENSVRKIMDAEFHNGREAGIREFYRVILEDYPSADVETLRLLKERLLSDNKKFRRYHI